MSETTPLMLGARGRVTLNDPARGLPGRAVPLPKQKPIVLIEDNGAASYTTLRKQALVTDLQLRHRDIRALDPAVALPYPSAIFIRKQALVINLEGLKLIIGREKCLVISVPQLNDLSARTLPTLDNSVVQQLAKHIANSRFPFSENGDLLSHSSFVTLDEINQMEVMPFELRALEAALLIVVKILEQEVSSLEARTSPVLARIRSGIRRADLELLYEIQNKLAKLINRVGKTKEILEELLDDELQMAGLCLSKEAALAAAAAAAAAAVGSPPGRWPSGTAGPGSPPAGPGSEGGGAAGIKCEDTAMDMDTSEVDEAEDLVEAYWLQADSLLSRLDILQERIKTTEHLVNLDLDAKRNALVALGLAVDLMLMAFETHMAVTGIFGMNLESGLERWNPFSLWGVSAFGLLLGLSLTAAVGLYAKRKGLLFLPSFGLSPVGAATA